MKRNILGYIYYRFYDFLCIFKTYDIYYATAHLLSIVVGFYVIHILTYINYLPQFKADQYFFAFGLYISCMSLFYFTVLKRRKYLSIVDVFTDESVEHKNIGRVVVSVILFFAVAGFFILK